MFLTGVFIVSIVSETGEIKRILKVEFQLSESEIDLVIRSLNGSIVFPYEEFHFPKPGRPHYTEFDVTGMPIVHSTKFDNYRINFKKLLKSSELHETAMDIFENALSVHRLVYRIFKFGLMAIKITLPELESSIYYLLCKLEISPIISKNGYEIISKNLKNDFDKNITHNQFQAALIVLCDNGLISLDNDIISILEHPRHTV